MVVADPKRACVDPAFSKVIKMDQVELKKLLRYDPETGIFWRIKARTGPNARVGMRAGWLRSDGYWGIKIGPKEYKASRLAWFYVTGAWPKAEMDHIDSDRSNNRWINLREATRQQNNVNRRPYNATGFKGVFMVKKSPKKPFGASIRVNGKAHYLGCYSSKEEANKAYCEAAIKFHGVYARGA